MHYSKIEWAEKAWNPITGCLGECNYCISRKKSKRFASDKRMNLNAMDQYRKEGELFVLDKKFISASGGTLSHPFGFEPTVHRYRFDYLSTTKSTLNILVSGDGDMFGPWIPDELIMEIFGKCSEYPKNHYLFLTRYPARYRELAERGLLPAKDNFWYGVTANSKDDEYFWDSKYKRFVVIEPLLEPLNNFPVPYVDWVIIGAETGSRKGKVIPSSDWIEEFVENCTKADMPVYMVDSLKEIVSEACMRKEFPTYLLQKELSDKKKAKLIGNCCRCKVERRKNEMVALLARTKRGVQPKQFAYICKECFIKECTEKDIPIPELSGWENMK